MKLWATKGYEWAQQECLLLVCPTITGATSAAVLDSNQKTNNQGQWINSNNAATVWAGTSFGTVINANNISERVDFPNIPQINAGEVTFSIWYYTATISGLNTLFNNWSSVATTGGFYCFRNGAAIAFQAANLNYRVTTGNILTAGAWHHIVCVRRNGVSGMRVYCNSVADPASATAGGNQTSTQPFNLFGNYGGTGAGNCQVAEFGIWRYAWTQNNVATYFNAGINKIWQREPVRPRSYFAELLTTPNRRRSSRFLAYPG